MLCRICSRGSVVLALRLISERLPVLIQAVCFCPSGLCAPTLFKSSETKPALTRRRGGLPPRDNSYFQYFGLDWDYSVQRWNSRPDIRTSVLLPISSRFNLAIGWALTWSLYTAPPDFAKCNAFLQDFANKQCLTNRWGAFGLPFENQSYHVLAAAWKSWSSWASAINVLIHDLS